jgi:hypothetical protein
VDSLHRIIEQLNAPLENSQEWTIKGKVESTIPEQTRVFFDDDVKGFRSTGTFDLSRRCPVKNGKPELPVALCIFNKSDGYKVIDLERDLQSSDINAFNIVFNDSAHLILINNPVDIRSKARDSLRYINNYAERFPLVKETILRVNPGVLKK